MEHQQWEPQFVYLKDKSQAINIKHDVSSTNKTKNPKLQKSCQITFASKHFVGNGNMNMAMSNMFA